MPQHDKTPRAGTPDKRTRHKLPGKTAAALLFVLFATITLTLLCFRQPVAERISLEMRHAVHAPVGAEETASISAQAHARVLGPATLIPPVLTVALAFLTREVISSLLMGVLSGFALLYLSKGPQGGVLRGALHVADSSVRALIQVLSDPFHCSVIVLCLVIGGLVGVIRVSGGFMSLAKKLLRRVKTPRGAQLTAELMGVLIFFDDYANALIVGQVMRPVTDRLGVSRERLAYIVDSTAAPVAGIAVISSWISTELAAIEGGLALAGASVSAYPTFLGSIPYCFYNIFCLFFILAGILMRREYGPMLAAEIRARQGRPNGWSAQGRACLQPPQEPQTAGGPGRLWITIVPITALCLTALAGFYVSGMHAAAAQGLLPEGLQPLSIQAVSIAFGAADTITILIKAALLSGVIAIVLGLFMRAFPFIKAVEAWLAGASELLVTSVILGLAWSLSAAVEQLGTAHYLVELVTLNLPYWLVPTLIFSMCCVISFAAGSYGCMLIVMPMAIPVAYSVASAFPGQVANPSGYVCACVAAVLSGSIFGDHCSPITDTTILSSAGAGCDSIEHVRTQLPYALTIAAISAVAGMLPAGFGVSPAISLVLGLPACVAVLGIFGKCPGEANDPRGAGRAGRRRP